MSDYDPLALDLNLLTGEFRSSLCDAINRASTHLEELAQARVDGGNGKTHVIAAGTLGD